jgi:hypothetical protein
MGATRPCSTKLRLGKPHCVDPQRGLQRGAMVWRTCRAAANLPQSLVSKDTFLNIFSTLFTAHVRLKFDDLLLMFSAEVAANVNP